LKFVAAIASLVGAAFLGLIAAQQTAENDRKASLREDRREAYTAMLAAADSCADIPSPGVVIAATADAASGDVTEEEVSQAIAITDESNIACRRGTRLAEASVRLLTFDDEITRMAAVLGEQARVRFVSELAAVQALGRADLPGGQEVLEAANKTRDDQQVVYNEAVDDFVAAAGAETQRGSPWWRSDTMIAVLVLGAVALVGLAIALGFRVAAPMLVPSLRESDEGPSDRGSSTTP
jgi:hypothetical protein